MFTHPSDQPVALPAVTVHDRALLLSLSQTDNQTVWRFDLDHLIEQGFRVTGRDGFYDLSITDLNGSEQLLARFLDKNEAHRLLASIHFAISTSSTDAVRNCDCSTTPSLLGKNCGVRGLCRTLFGWLTFWRLLTLLALALFLYFLLRPFPHAVPVALTTSDLPVTATGIPLDADQLLK